MSAEQLRQENSNLIRTAAQLEEAMADLERSRTDFEHKAHVVGTALRQLQQDVAQADMPVTAQREELGAELRKRRRLSSATAPPAGQLPDWHVNINEEKQKFNEAAVEAAEKLQRVSQAMAQVHMTVQQARATVDAAKAEAAPLLGPERLAAAREARNGSCSGLLEMLGRSDLGRPYHATVLEGLSLAAVWRLRGVSRAFRGWCASALAAIPRVVAVGGNQPIDMNAQLYGGVLIPVGTAISLNLATLTWSRVGTVPDLPTPRVGFSLSQLQEGRLVVTGGEPGEKGEARDATAAAVEWAPGRTTWTTLTPMRDRPRAYPTAAALSDGRVLVAGGYYDDGTDLASVEMLAADGSGWTAITPMATARYGAVAGRLPGGQIIVAGGATGHYDVGAADLEPTVLASTELWDPATSAWAELPPMAQIRYFAAGCVLPSGRFAVLGGMDDDDDERADAEAFDPENRAWEQLPPMPHPFAGGAAVAVAGGLLAVGGNGHADAMLFDEESGRWFTLPGQMPTFRWGHALTTTRAA
jgi:hypothetical protein